MDTTVPLLSVALRREEHLLLARQRGRHICRFLSFSDGDTTRITTALSEVARNAFEYAGGGSVSFAIGRSPSARQELIIRVVDDGAGIADVAAVLSPNFKSRTGMGIGIRGSRALMDRFDIVSAVGGGTTVVMAKWLPSTASVFALADAGRLCDELARASDATPLGELQIQNQALLHAFQELTRHQSEVERLSEIARDARDRAEAAQLVAERSQVVRERFMALTTHELRTPLSAIVGYLELLEIELASSTNERQQNYFGRVQRACKHLLGITNDFLEMAQGRAGQLRVARREGAAHHVMSEAASLVAPQAAARNVTVRLTETESLAYLGDVDRVRQVLVNILGNAVSFTPSGGTVDIIATRASLPPLHTALPPGAWCVIRVEDTGPGIPQAKLSQVFEPFVQLPSHDQSTRAGNGLGLTVSRQLALLMGGDLIVASTDAGAVFSLWLVEGRADPSPARESAATRAPP